MWIALQVVVLGGIGIVAGYLAFAFVREMIRGPEFHHLLLLIGVGVFLAAFAFLARQILLDSCRLIAKRVKSIIFRGNSE